MQVLVAVLIAAAAVTVAPAVAGRQHLPRSRTLLVVGDSLTVGTRPYLSHYLHGWRMHTDATVSKQVTEGPRTLRRFGRHLPRAHAAG